MLNNKVLAGLDHSLEGLVAWVDRLRFSFKGVGLYFANKGGFKYKDGYTIATYYGTYR